MSKVSPPEEPPAQNSKEPLKDCIHIHIAAQSANRVGLCLTLLGLLRVVEGLKRIDTVADEISALAALAFLVSGTLAYFAMRSEKPRAKYTAGRAADAIFLASHGLLALICLIVAYELV
ncbi:MAG: hypothetical protein H0V27_08625 [Pyrinomonadaceae bacterium]|nr:hypothetical protein [Pyrinomonadaceae bacterium]